MIFPWGFWVIVGIVLAIALILMPMAFHADPAPRRPTISRPIPRVPAPAPPRSPAPPGPLPVALRAVEVARG